VEKTTEARVGGRTLSHRAGDCVRLAGRGSRPFRFVALVRQGEREWIDAYGPLAPDGSPLHHAKLVSVRPEDVVAKVRTAPERSTYLTRAGLGPQPKRRR
jgi:hypothetical protein